MRKLVKKFDLSKLKQDFVDKMATAPDLANMERIELRDSTGKLLSPELHEKMLELIRNTKHVDPQAELAKIESREFKASTPNEAWLKLMSIADSAESGEPLLPNDAMWLLAAINRTKKQDIERLTRELGFIEMGAPRQHDRFKISDRVLEIYNSGLSKMAAAQQAADEFGCSKSLAYHYGFRIRKTLAK